MNRKALQKCPNFGLNILIYKVINLFRFVFNQTKPTVITREEQTRSRKLRYKAHRDFLVRTIEDFSVVVFHGKDLPSSKLLREVNKLRPTTVDGRSQIWGYFIKVKYLTTLFVKIFARTNFRVFSRITSICAKLREN